MKILLLTQVLPYPPDSGPKVKTWNVLKYLRLHHEVTLVSFVRGDQSKEIEHLKKFCNAVHAIPMERGLLNDGLALLESLLTGQPWLISRDRRTGMHELISKVTQEEQFDVVHADQLNMAQYAEPVKASKRVLDEHNAMWLLYRRMAETMPQGLKKWLLERDWRLLRTYEGRICREFNAVIAVSDVDRDALREVAGDSARLFVMPIAVDTDEFRPIRRAEDANRIVHVGTMFWPPNVDGILWFAREVLPIIRRSKPDVEFDIIGARPPQEVIELEQRDRRTHVTGYVEDVEPYLARAGVMIVPLRAGGGMRVKILNALSQALPVVTTTIGCEGISVEDGKHVLIADQPQDFADAVVRLLDHRSLADRLGENGRAFIKTCYDLQTVCATLEQAYG